MSMLNSVTSFINTISDAVADNPFGLSQGKIDEIDQILRLIKVLINDGIQRGDISKLVTLMGEMAEHLPEFKPEIDDMITGLKKLSKKLFGDDPSLANSGKSQGGNKGLLAMESSLANPQDPDIMLSGTSQVVPPGTMIMDNGSEKLHPELLKSAKNDIDDIAHKILNFVNDQMVLSNANFDALSKGLTRISNRARHQSGFSARPVDDVTPPVVDDYKVSGTSESPLP